MKKKLILKNSIISFFCQLLSIIISFVVRKLFVKYIGVETLGINSTFVSVIETLSLAELGFETAVSYNLYRPIKENDKEEIIDIMCILKKVYNTIGLLFVVASIIAIPFLKYILKGIKVDEYIYIYFILQIAVSVCTYFLAYKRTLLYADQKDYISKTIDMSINIVSNLLQCVIIIKYHNYILYLIVRIIQNLISNILIRCYCSKHYFYLETRNINKELFIKIWSDVKNIFSGKIAGYIYRATDNLLISSFIGTASVGYLSMYTIITKSIKNLSDSLLNPLVPIIGNYFIVTEESKKKKFFFIYSYIKYMVAVIIIIPMLILINDFIALWVGKNMVLDEIIPILLAADFYIHIVHGSNLDYINAAGLYKDEKNIEIIGALVNLFSSILLMRKVGIAGVLLGTVISQIVFWIGRSYIVFFKYLFLEKREYINYWMDNIKNIILFVIAYFICSKLYQLITLPVSILKLLVGGVVCETFLLIYLFLVFQNSNYRVKEIVIKYLHK